MKPYRAAAIQMTSLPDLDKNLARAERLIERAVDESAQLVGLPENFSFLRKGSQPLREAEAIARASEGFLKRMAKRFGVTLLGGGYPVPAERGKVYNTALLIDDSGQEVARYRKIHLFDVDLPDGNTFRESETVRAGLRPCPVFSSPRLGKLGLSVCYDVRFPELYRHLSSQGAEVLFVPAAFTACTGKDHWEVLLRARAIENACYLIAPAQTGQHGGSRRSHGHAMIVDPWGLVLADAGKAPGVAVAEIDPARLQEVRRRLPCLHHRVLS
ncbi:MAG: carbon-nitrogen hydrolase family protein [Acidobacteriota bacterium]